MNLHAHPNDDYWDYLDRTSEILSKMTTTNSSIKKLRTKMTLTIHGNLKSQKRHRTGRGGHRYDPSSKDKKAMQKALLPIKPPKPLTGKFELVITAYFQTPTSWSKVRREAFEGKYRAKTPDTDNIEKIIMDAMNNYIIEDDRYIVRTVTEKRYSINPRTEIEINEVS